MHDVQQLQRQEGPPRQRPQDVALLRIIDIQPVLAHHADLEGDLLNLLQRHPPKQPQRIQQIENASSPARCRRSSGEGEAVHGLRVLGIDLERAAQVVESPQAGALLAEDGAQVLEGHRVPGIGGKSLHGVLPGPQQVARSLVAERQGYAVR